ncbi:MAG TPA: class I SAM-dependent methyltransferase [Geminicoccaceae bacterium]
MVDFAAIKTRQQATWADGDFGMIAWNTVFTGELLCEAAGLRAGQKALDVACGSGNVALSAARRFADAVGVDYVPALIERARERAAAERLPARFEVGDAEALPFEDARFDVVLSTFGVMFAPDQEKAASELVRVCRPGGTIALANWTPDGMWGELFKLHGRHLPPPAGVKPPPLWGTEARVRELLGSAVRDLRAEKRTAVFRQLSARHWFDFFRAHFGPTRTVLAALDDAGRERFAHEVEGVLERFDRGGGDTLVAEAEYLEVVGTRA